MKLASIRSCCSSIVIPLNRHGILLSASIALGAVMLAIGFNADLDLIRSAATYGNYDLPGTESWVMKLHPGIGDLASSIVYGEFHRPPLIFISILFIFMLAVSIYRNSEDFMHRKFAQWSAFALARMGVLRVSGLCPVSRTAFGSFNFLNCQACEMATGACPVGMLQWSLIKMEFPFLVLGTLIISGAFLGRAVCGWLCPFGFLSDAVDRISVKRLRIPAKVSYLKFLVLALLITAVFWPYPLFCTFLCQSGVVYGLMPYYLTTGLPAFKQALLQGSWMGEMLGFHIFSGLLLILVAITVSGRWFCRYLCPLGAWYGLFNYVSPIKVTQDESRCSGCGKCSKSCPMDVDLGKRNFLNVTGCIKCGRCIKACSEKARSFSIAFANSDQSRWAQSDGESCK